MDQSGALLPKNYLYDFSEEDKLKLPVKGQTNQASRQATGHPEAVGVDSAEAIVAIKVGEVLEP